MAPLLKLLKNEFFLGILDIAPQTFHLIKLTLLSPYFILGNNFIGDDDVCLILGDNIFYGKTLPSILKSTYSKVLNGNQSIIFASRVNNPQRYGVIEFGDNDSLVSVEEKPSFPKSNYAVPGLYYYDNSVVEIAKNIKPSARGEYEITDVNKEYLRRKQLDVQVLGRGTTWLDTGTFASLMQANQYVQVIEERQGRKIGCIEEAAYRMGYIDDAKLLEIADPLRKSGYGEYLVNLVKK